MSRAQFAMRFAGTTVEWAQKGLELTVDEIAQTVGVDRKTVARWRDKRSVPSAEHRKDLERLNQLRHLLETAFRSREPQQRWLHTPSPALKGKTPLFALTEGQLDEVIKLLGTLAAGAFR